VLFCVSPKRPFLDPRKSSILGPKTDLFTAHTGDPNHGFGEGGVGGSETRKTPFLGGVPGGPKSGILGVRGPGGNVQLLANSCGSSAPFTPIYIVFRGAPGGPPHPPQTAQHSIFRVAPRGTPSGGPPTPPSPPSFGPFWTPQNPPFLGTFWAVPNHPFSGSLSSLWISRSARRNGLEAGTPPPSCGPCLWEMLGG
jgi:hypothetical protein